MGPKRILSSPLGGIAQMKKGDRVNYSVSICVEWGKIETLGIKHSKRILQQKTSIGILPVQFSKIAIARKIVNLNQENKIEQRQMYVH
jgi:hypothetical protein